MDQNNDKLAQILDKANILDVIGQYVPLEKSGKNYFGVCPFHDDTNPSMSVSQEKKIFKCFSCGAGGNAVNFVSRIENIPFLKAMQKIGESVGIKVDVKVDKDSALKAKYYDILSQSAQFYQFYLQNTEHGKQAKTYLQSRNLTEDILEQFEIGLSPKENDLLYQALLKTNVVPLDMIELGLVKHDQEYYDVFRNRIIFPICDLQGNKVGFSGRIYDGSQSSHKYVNSPETIIFKKSQILYNYHQAANEIKKLDMVYIFEGFMDVIAAYRADVFNAIATMGTALTQEHIQAIKRLTNRVVLCFDGDNAGIEASKRASAMLLQAGLDVKIVLFPDDLDPDDYIKKYSTKALAKYLAEEQISSLEFLYRIAHQKLDKTDPQALEQFKKTIFKALSFYRSNVLNEIYIKRLSEDLGVSAESLKDDFSQTKQEAPEIEVPPIQATTYVPSDPEVIVQKYTSAEKMLLITSMESKENCERIYRELDHSHVQLKYYQLLASLNDYYRSNHQIDMELLKRNLSKDQIELVDNLLRETQFDISFIELETSKLINLVKQYPNEKKFQQQRKQLLEKRSQENLSVSDVTAFRDMLKKRKRIIQKKNENE